MRRYVLALGLALSSLTASAQESASYKLNEHTFNAAGNPSDGILLTSSSFKITLDAVGGAVVARELVSASFHADAGFTSGYPPPGEVLGLFFADAETLVWTPERSAGNYNLYRELMSSLSSLGYGTCLQFDLNDATATDSEPVPGGDGYFYLVTARNRLDEEGTKGRDSRDSERPNPSPCP